MAGLIRLLLANFTLTFFIVSLVSSAIALWRAPRPLSTQAIIEALLKYFLLFSIAASVFYNFVFHVFFGELAAGFIGWEDSPFQAEVGFASLGFAIVGLMAVKGDAPLRLGAIVGPAIFLWGAAAGHVYQMITAGNFEPGNAGVIFWTDVFIPVIGLALYWLGYHTHG